MARSTARGLVLSLLLAGALPLVADEGEAGWSYDGNLAYRSGDGQFELDIINRVQFRFVGSDPELGDSGRSFDVHRYRLTFAGRAYEDWVFQLQSDLATGSLADDEEDSNLLLDANVAFARMRIAQLWVGQGKVGFGRQFLIDSGYFQFVDRSIATERFVHGRDVGIAAVGESDEGTYGYSVGIYNGNGINEAVDEPNKDVLIAARLAVAPLGPMPLVESDPEWRRRPEPRVHVGVAAMTTKLGDGTLEEERVNSGALEFAFRARGFTLAGEFFTESRDALIGPPANEADTDGWYGQAGYAFPVGEVGVLEIAGRYSEVLPDVAALDRSEAGGAVGFYFRGHRGKLQLDYRELRFEGVPFGERIDTDEVRLQLQLIF